MFDKTGRGLITWRELSSLLKALGIPDIPTGLLNRMSVEHTPDNSPGLEYKPFINLLQSESFSSTLDYTYNRHNSTYNIRVIKKAISLLVDGFLTLSTLRAARLGFTLYEGETCTGLTLDASSLCSALRVSGLSISPKKLSVWLSDIEEDVPGRLQLYEFLDLVKLCSDRFEQTKAVPNVSSTVERSKVGLFELTDPNFLLTPGQKLNKHMDDDYDSVVSLINSQQIPPRETLSSSKKSTSPDFNYTSHSRNSKRVEEGLDLYGQIRESVISSTAYVQNARTSHSSASTTSRYMPTRPHSVAENRTKSRLPSLQISPTMQATNRRSASAPAIRMDSQRSVKMLDSEHDGREPVPRHMTASAPLLRGGFAKDKTDAFDEGEFALPERRLEKYETLRGYIATNGEASLSRIVTSSIGASHKQPSHLSPPSSPHLGKMEDRKKKVKVPKRAFEERRNLKSSQGHKDHRFSVDSLANNLEDIINSNKPYMGEMARAPSTRKPSMHLNDDVDIELPSALVRSSSHSAEGGYRRTRNESPARSITFNLNPAGN